MACYVNVSGHLLTADTLDEMLALAAQCGLELKLYGGWMKTNVQQSNALHRAGAIRASDRKVGMVATALREAMEQGVDLETLDASPAVDADQYVRWAEEQAKPKAAVDIDRELYGKPED